jgi:hypothetical protein
MKADTHRIGVTHLVKSRGVMTTLIRILGPRLRSPSYWVGLIGAIISIILIFRFWSNTVEQKNLFFAGIGSLIAFVQSAEFGYEASKSGARLEWSIKEYSALLNFLYAFGYLVSVITNLQFGIALSLVISGLATVIFDFLIQLKKPTKTQKSKKRIT